MMADRGNKLLLFFELILLGLYQWFSVSSYDYLKLIY